MFDLLQHDPHESMSMANTMKKSKRKFSSKRGLASLYMATPTFITNLKNLAYNILKTFEDSLVDNIEVPELDECSRRSNKIFLHPHKSSYNLMWVSLRCFSILPIIDDVLNPEFCLGGTAKNSSRMSTRLLQSGYGHDSFRESNSSFSTQIR